MEGHPFLKYFTNLLNKYIARDNPVKIKYMDLEKAFHKIKLGSMAVIGQEVRTSYQ